MEKIYELTPNFWQPFDFEIEPGILFIYKDYTLHLCPCGCGERVYAQIKSGEYSLQNNNGLITIRPSFGNWKGQKPYHAHYFITNNKIEWL